MNKFIKLTICVVTTTCFVLVLQSQFEYWNSELKTIEEIATDICSRSGDPVTDDERKAVQDFRESMINSNPDLKLKVLIEGDDTDKDMEARQQALGEIAIPWIIMVVLTVLSWLSLMVCYSDCCPLSDCCRCQRATKNRDLNLSLGFTFVLSLIGVAFCIAGLAMSGQVEESVQSIRCSVVKAYEDLAEGNKDSDDPEIKKWTGLKGLSDTLGGIVTQLDGFIKQTDEQFKDIDPEELKKQQKSLLNENKKLDMTVVYNSGPSYYVQNSALKYLVDGTNTIQSVYVGGQLSKAECAPQEQLFDGIYDGIIDQISTVKQNGQQIVDDQIQIKDGIVSAQEQLNSDYDKIEKDANKFDSDSEDINNYGNAASGIFYIYFGVTLFFIVIVVISIFCIYCNNLSQCLVDIKCCKAFMFIGCQFYFLLMLIGFIICVALSIGTAFEAEGCDYFDGIISVRSRMEESSLFSDSDKDTLIECLFDEGDLLNNYDAKDSIQQISDLDDSIKTFNAATATYKAALINGDAKLKNNQKFIKSFISAARVDSSEPSTYAANSAADALNIKYIMTTTLKDCNQNSIVDQQSNCNANQKFYDPTVDANFPASDSLCMQSAVLSLSRSSISAKYSGCTVKNKYDQVQSFADEQAIKWQPVDAQENNILDSHKQTQSLLDGKIDKITKYQASVSAYLNSITDPEVGVLATVNCKFLKATLRRVLDAGCVKTFQISYLLYIFIAIISAVMFLSTCTIFRVVVGVKQIQNPKPQDGQPNNGGLQIQVQQQDNQEKYGMPPGYPQQNNSGMPPGYPQQNNSGMPPGYPQQNNSGMPPGYPQGFPPQYPGQVYQQVPQNANPDQPNQSNQQPYMQQNGKQQM